MAMTVLQLVAMWSIVGAAIFWFVRDEKRRYDESLRARALVFARVPHYRHPAPKDD